MIRILMIAAMSALLAIPLAACGKKGEPLPPRAAVEAPNAA